MKSRVKRSFWAIGLDVPGQKPGSEGARARRFLVLVPAGNTGWWKCRHPLLPAIPAAGQSVSGQQDYRLRHHLAARYGNANLAGPV